MGVMNHNAIIATTWDQKEIDRAMLWVNEKPEAQRGLFLIGEGLINTEATICLIPDGSKEGWNESNETDRLRDEFTTMLDEAKHGDGSSPWCWVEVGFGEYGQKVLRGNNRNMYSDREYEV